MGQKKNKMKVALIHDWLNGMRGGEKVLEHICDIFPDAPIFSLHGEIEKLSDKLKNKKIQFSFIQKLPLKNKFYRYYLPLYPKAIESFNLKDYDIAISTSHCAAKGIKTHKNLCHISYCFTPIRYVWDFSEEYFGAKKYIFSPILKYIKSWDIKTSKRVYKFITISKTVQRRIKNYYQRESTIIYPPCNYRFTPHTKKKDYYLILSALVPYKKIDLAIEVFNELKYPLIIAGTGPEEKKLKKIAQRNIKFLGWIDENKKIELYKNAKAFIFPGVEDFGITPLEAIAFGTPVIAINKGGVTETVTNETGIFFDSQTKDSLQKAIKQFEKKPFTITNKPKNFDEFSPDNFKSKFKKEIENTYKEFTSLPIP